MANFSNCVLALGASIRALRYSEAVTPNFIKKRRPTNELLQSMFSRGAFL